jgi:hypothetical protein
MIGHEWQLFALVLLEFGFFWHYVQRINATSNWINIMEHQLIGWPMLARSQLIAILLLKYLTTLFGKKIAKWLEI